MSQLFTTPFNLTIFGAVLTLPVIGALFACYRIGIAYTRQAQAEVDLQARQRPAPIGAKPAAPVAWERELG